jgi:hypothetical protein
MDEEIKGDKNEKRQEVHQNELFFNITDIRSINHLSIRAGKAENL